MEKNNIEIQIENLKSQTVLLERLLKMNQQYENKYGLIENSENSEINVVKSYKYTDNKKNYSSIFYRRSIC